MPTELHIPSVCVSLLPLSLSRCLFLQSLDSLHPAREDKFYGNTGLCLLFHIFVLHLPIPVGTGATAYVAVEDIADSAVACFLNPKANSGKTYDLTGPEVCVCVWFPCSPFSLSLHSLRDTMIAFEGIRCC